MDADAAMLDDWTAYWHEKQVSSFPQVGWKDADLPRLPDWYATHAQSTARAIVGAPGDFDAHYGAYQQLFQDNGFDAGMQAYQAKWQSLFAAYVKRYWKQ